MNLNKLETQLKKEAAEFKAGTMGDVITALQEFEDAAVFVHNSDVSPERKVERVQAFARETFVQIYSTIHAMQPEKTDELLVTIGKKNADYGDSFGNLVRLYGDVAMSIRISDKLSRLKSLTSGNKQQVNDEAIEDSLVDVLGYQALIIGFEK